MTTPILDHASHFTKTLGHTLISSASSLHEWTKNNPEIAIITATALAILGITCAIAPVIITFPIPPLCYTLSTVLCTSSIALLISCAIDQVKNMLTAYHSASSEFQSIHLEQADPSNVSKYTEMVPQEHVKEVMHPISTLGTPPIPTTFLTSANLYEKDKNKNKITNSSLTLSSIRPIPSISSTQLKQSLSSAFYEVPYIAHDRIATIIGYYLGKDEPQRLDKQRAIHRQIFVMDESPLSLSPKELLLGLQFSTWKLLIDKEHHQHGPLCYDTGAHRYGFGLVEPGFLENGLKALDYATEHATPRATLSLYKNIHRIACQHFNQHTVDFHVTHMTAENAGRFARASHCGPSSTSALFIVFPKSIQAALGYHVEDYTLPPEKIRQERLAETEREKVPARMDALNVYITQRSAALSLNPIASIRPFQTGWICWYEVKNEKEFVKAVFKAFNEYMARPLSKAERIRACADLFQVLEWGHVFPDGQGRTDLIFLYTMLAQWGLNPPILEYPYFSTASCLDEWEDRLIDGMINWQSEMHLLKVLSES